MRFFKCGKGEYGEGDRFLGIRVPVTRALVKEYRRTVDLADVIPLIKSPWHEIRLAGFLLLIEIYKRSKKRSSEEARNIVDYYLTVLEYGNNWDLVDLVAGKILGDRLVDHHDERHILYRLADMENSLWHQRVAIVSTFALICDGQYDDTLQLACRYLSHKHDLIHKATGWMLREIGKRGGKTELCRFLDSNAHKMPRTALRYAIEHFPEPERHRYMKQTTNKIT